MTKALLFWVALALTLPAGAASVTYNINGSMGKLNNMCFNIVGALTGNDCAYANTRSPPLIWRGPIDGGAYYAKGSVGDSLTYVPVVGDAKINVPLTGTVTIDDNDTPADGTDDLISATFVFGAAVFNAQTGNGDRALERWDSFTHTMAPTPVNAATAQPGGGFEYVIGARGKPTPAPLFIDGNPADTFPSENAKTVTDGPPVWDDTAATNSPVAQRVGIERSLGFSSAGGTPETFVQNIGATTTASFENYECIDDVGDFDCAGSSFSSNNNRSSATLFGPNRDKDDDGVDDVDPFSAPFAGFTADGRAVGPDTNTVPLGPGFSNLILIMTTSSDGIASADAYWTREYILTNGPKLSMEPASPAPLQFTVNNSWEGNRFTFSSDPRPVSANDDSADTVSGRPVIINVLSNDTGFDDPVTVGLWVTPTHGTVQIENSPGPKAGVVVSYQPEIGFSGEDQFSYVVDDGVHVDTAVVTVQVVDDPDSDGIPQAEDNCTAVANPDQRDTDGDGFGNMCDGDLNNNGFVNYVDLSLFRAQFGTAGPHADHDGNGIVNFTDLAIFRSLFGRPPGPSGVAP